MINNTLHYDTPEGIRLELVPVGITPRVMAWALDALVRAIMVFGLTLLSMSLGEAGIGLGLFGFFLIFWLYPVICEVFWHGQTIGKRTFKIRVCMDNGMPVGLQASMIRNLLIMADFLPFGFALGLISMLFFGHCKRLGDFVAGTIVVYETPKASQLDIAKAVPILPPMRLKLNEQQAILHFVERQDTLPPRRVAELSQILTPLMQSPQESPKSLDPTATIIGYANAITGADKVATPPNPQRNTPQ